MLCLGVQDSVLSVMLVLVVLVVLVNKCATGGITNLSPSLWHFGHLTKLYLRNNQLISLPADVAHLSNLIHLDVSTNKLHSLPPELGDIVSLKELLLSNNNLGHLPYELGKLFQLQKLGQLCLLFVVLSLPDLVGYSDCFFYCAHLVLPG